MPGTARRDEVELIDERDGLGAASAASSSSWSMSGQGITSWRYQPNENKISSDNAGRLAPAWVANLAGDVSSTPAVVDGVVYAADWGGSSRP